MLFIEGIITIDTGFGDAGQNRSMPRYRPDPRKHPIKPGGEGWLVSEQQQLVCHFKADTPSIHAHFSSNPSADAQAQRHRGLADDV